MIALSKGSRTSKRCGVSTHEPSTYASRASSMTDPYRGSDIDAPMASERGRVIAIFLVVALIAGGAGFYFIKIYRPKQVKQDAQDEIVAWEARFKAARDCLLGPKPGSAKTSEALAIREMAPDPWDRGKCTPLISKLTRGE